MEITTLEKANLINKNIKAKKENIDKLNNLFKSTLEVRITDGYSKYKPSDKEYMKEIITKALIKEKEELKELEFQLNIL